MKRMRSFMAAVLLASAYLLSSEPVISTVMGVEEEPVIVLDAGHGGVDGGKVSLTGTLEKDINLAITRKVQELLEQEGIRVILTRDSDDGLYEENVSNKKISDLKKRCQIMEEKKADFAVSIHQNSFTQESVAGAQVFYYDGSEEGKKLANDLQKNINEELGGNHTRKIKANSDYYLLRYSSCPCVIVECGFLSNPEEARLLETEEYQMQMAECIKKGILAYLSQNP